MSTALVRTDFSNVTSISDLILKFRNDSDRTSLCSKRPDMCSVGDIASTLCFVQSKRE